MKPEEMIHEEIYYVKANYPWTIRFESISGSDNERVNAYEAVDIKACRRVHNGSHIMSTNNIEEIRLPTEIELMEFERLCGRPTNNYIPQIFN